MADSPAQNDPWTISRLLTWTRSHFETHKLDQPRLCAELLLSHALNCPKIQLYTDFERIPDAAPLSAFRELVKRAAQHEPIAYLLGSKEFFSLEFEVNHTVLVPRPETETLVQLALDHGRGTTETIHVLDIGTGSGCIAVAIAKYLVTAQIVATDISPEALAVAQRNANQHDVANRIRFIEADGFEFPESNRPNDGFDLICTNPPYVAQDEASTLPPEVRDYEPAEALFGGSDGLEAYRSLADGVGAWLRPGGRFITEIGMGQAEAVIELFSKPGVLQHVKTHPDAAHIERVVEFVRT